MVNLASAQNNLELIWEKRCAQSRTVPGLRLTYQVYALSIRDSKILLDKGQYRGHSGP